MTACISLAEVASVMLILARTRDAVTSESGAKVRSVVPHEFVLLQAGKANMHNLVVEGRAEYKRRPVSDSMRVSAPGACFALRNALFVDVVMSRCRFFIPLIICTLVWIGKLAGLAGFDSQWDCLGFGSFAM